MARKPRADGVTFARETAADLARPLPEPVFELSSRGAKYWPIVVGAKRIEAWTPSDLFIAANLCEDYGELERLRRIMMRQSPILPAEGKKGGYVTHPIMGLIEGLSARITRTCRALQIHAHATQGRSEHQREKNEAARNIASAIDDADDLIARPIIRVVR